MMLIYDSRDRNNTEDDMDILRYRLTKFFQNDTFVLQGTIQCWDGPSLGGYIFKGYYEFIRCISDVADFKLVDNHGKFLVEAYHHDGTNRYEVKRLTEEGLRYYNNKGRYISAREANTKLMNNSKYSRCPRYYAWLRENDNRGTWVVY